MTAGDKCNGTLLGWWCQLSPRNLPQSHSPASVQWDQILFNVANWVFNQQTNQQQFVTLLKFQSWVEVVLYQTNSIFCQFRQTMTTHFFYLHVWNVFSLFCLREIILNQNFKTIPCKWFAHTCKNVIPMGVTRAMANSSKNHALLMWRIWKMGWNFFSSLDIKENPLFVLFPA